MINKVEQELKDLLYLNRITVLEVANKANVTYASMCSYLNGYVAMPERIRKASFTSDQRKTKGKRKYPYGSNYETAYRLSILFTAAGEASLSLLQHYHKSI